MGYSVVSVLVAIGLLDQFSLRDLSTKKNRHAEILSRRYHVSLMPICLEDSK